MQFDLHTHSNVSDGQLSPEDVVRMAGLNGATMLALTDHDHLGGLYEAAKVADELGIQFIPGVEVSTSWRNRNIHVVGLNVDYNNTDFQKNLAKIRSGRLDRLVKINARFEKKGIRGVYDGALALSSNADMVGRAHVARFLVNQGIVKNTAQAFSKFLGEGKSAYVSHQWADFSEAVCWIRKAGGIAVLAHPGRYKLSATALRELIEEFKTAGGRAIEVASSSHAQNEILKFALLAERYELLASSGSDFHVLGEGGRVLGRPPVLPAICCPIWREFAVE